MAPNTKTMVFPRPVTLNVIGADGRSQKLQFKAGAQEVPAEHAEHPYLAANGVKVYDHKAEAKAAQERADKAQRDADRVRQGTRPAAAPAAHGVTTGELAEVERRETGDRKPPTTGEKPKPEPHDAGRTPPAEPGVGLEGSVGGADAGTHQDRVDRAAATAEARPEVLTDTPAERVADHAKDVREANRRTPAKSRRR